MSISCLLADKVAAIDRIGFGGLLLLATKELRYEFVQWLISAYNVPYHRIRMGRSVFVWGCLLFLQVHDLVYMTFGITYGTWMSQSLEIGEKSWLGYLEDVILEFK